MTLSAYIDGIGVCGPGLSDWDATRAILAGEAPYAAAATQLPPPTLLPPAERRRSGDVVKLALAIGLEAVSNAQLDPAELPSVFSSSGGDGHNCHAICEMLAGDDRLISPTRFHNSVHNAASGYWSIATGAMAPSSVLSAYDASFGAGLLEAVVQVAHDGDRCLLVAYDTGYPEPLRSTRPIPDAFGIAMVLSPQVGNRSLARVAVELTDAPPDLMADVQLDQLRADIPAARGLPLLQAIATGRGGRSVLDYLDVSRLAVSVIPV